MDEIVFNEPTVKYIMIIPTDYNNGFSQRMFTKFLFSIIHTVVFSFIYQRFYAPFVIIITYSDKPKR